MLVPKRLPAAGRLQHVVQVRALASLPAAQYGRTAAYRRISSSARSANLPDPPASLLTSSQRNLFSYKNLLPQQYARQSAFCNQPQSRPLHTASARLQQAQPKEDVKDPPREESTSEAEAGESSKASETGGKDENSEGAGGSKSEGEKKKDAPAPPPPHGDKSPWQVFTETLKTEFKASKEWNESTKQLGASAQQFTESEGVRKARAAQQAATTQTAQAFKTTAKAIGTGAAWTWETPVVQGVRAGINATGRGIEKATRPVRETETFKNIKDAVDDGSSSRYGGWIEKEERKRKRELRDLKEGGRRPIEKMEEDPNAGTNITLHKDSAFKESWNKFKDSSKFMQSFSAMKNTYEESENPLISTARSITDRIAGFFAENETAMVIKKFREMDPTFQIEPFLRDMREYILPEVLDAYVKGDVETLKLWLSAAQFQVYSALMQQYTTAGLKSDGKILDIRGVDILNARMLEPGEIPVFIITCRTQEVHVYRNKKTNELAAGMEDRVQLVTYAIGVTRLPEDVNNPETRGWRMIELQKAGRDYI